MNQKTLQAVIIEAERFLDLAKELHMQLAHVDWIHVRGNAASSAVLRASTGLSSALADLRRAS